MNTNPFPKRKRRHLEQRTLPRTRRIGLGRRRVRERRIFIHVILIVHIFFPGCLTDLLLPLLIRFPCSLEFLFQGLLQFFHRRFQAHFGDRQRAELVAQRFDTFDRDETAQIKNVVFTVARVLEPAVVPNAHVRVVKRRRPQVWTARAPR